MPVEVDSGHTAWLLVSSALVLLMTPGLALFYGGMTKSKGILNMMMMSFSSIGIVSLLWVFYGFSLAFGKTNGYFGDISQYAFMTQDLTGAWSELVPVPTFVFAVFQMMFAIITVALISGVLADRGKFAGWIIYAVLWASIVYFPVANWVWGGGWIFELGAFDFAGGTAVHINAGAAALGLAIILRKRNGWPSGAYKPHNVPTVALGAGLLWFGWFGFNAGSEGAADAIAGVAFLNTQVATAAAIIGWLVVEWIRDGKPTLLGASSGAIAGLVAITPACAFVEPIGAIGLGIVTGAICALAVGLKYKLGFDDSLDVVGVHMVGGLVGALSIGLIATQKFYGEAGPLGLFYGGGAGQLGKQAIAAFAVLAYSLIISMILGFAIDKTIGMTVTAEAESQGVDQTEHAESAYDFSAPTGGGAFAMAGIAPSAGVDTSVEPAPASEKAEKVAG
ncbi:ammonium transporter [Catenuloplanes sp. NPDC051500]|uniref:ammonium transporter n=1 Tax=Catenuloplanes sp. NPDC051500 TaxID=3363959 RepID=UPI0037AE0283